jgi:hypothetical protein
MTLLPVSSFLSAISPLKFGLCWVYNKAEAKSIHACNQAEHNTKE